MPSYLFKLCNLKFRQVLLSFIIIFSSPLHALSVWEVLAQELVLSHELRQAEVQSQLHWLISHPNYLQQLTKSKPYIYHIVSEIRKRGLPGELALLPMIESAFNPFAYSIMGAAGLWQIMPATGSDLGLKQDWWYDGRRNISSSTTAALNYLSYLHHYFNGDWLLAIAAYDAGEGAVSKAIKVSGQTGKINFWTLPLPAETKAYVPRLLALAEIMKDPAKYNLRVPDIPYSPYFEEVDIGSQIDLYHAAKLAGISYKDFIQLNPGFNRWATSPNEPFKLLIPIQKITAFTQNLTTIPQSKRVSFIQHRIQKGESLNSIANFYFTTPKLIRELNILKSDELIPGRVILIPAINIPVESKIQPPKVLPKLRSYKVIHIVQKGDTLEYLEKKYKVRRTEIFAWSNLQPGTKLIIGQPLIIWRHLH